MEQELDEVVVGVDEPELCPTVYREDLESATNIVRENGKQAC